MGCKKALWLGSYQSDELFRGMAVKHIGQASGFTSQKGLVKGFDQVLPEDTVLDTIGVITRPAYPQSPTKIVKREQWSRTGASTDVNIGYHNIKYYNRLSMSQSLMQEVKQWCKDNRNNQVETVIVYEPSVAKLKAAHYIKKMFCCKVFIVIPDIPELVGLGANPLVKFAKRLAAERMKKQFAKVDGFILYSKHMATYYHIPDGKWLVMEGVYDLDEAEINSHNDAVDDGVIRIMYCGALDQFRGIPQLLDAFDSLRDRKYELWLSGAGLSDKLIHERMKEDPRIHHFGYLNSRDEVLSLEAKADILIHTRDIYSPAAPYCFPSKLFEYFASANAVASVVIPGIPDEYFDYMTPIASLSVEDIHSAILSIVNMDQEVRRKRGKAAREFVLSKKNSVAQAGKILSFISANR